MNNSSTIDQLSLSMLSIQLPSYILNIGINVLNLLCGVLFLMAKGKSVYKLPVFHCILNELLSSFWSLGSFIYHLRNFLLQISEATTPFKCYQWSAGIIYFSTATSILFMFMVSIERGLSAMTPWFLKNTYNRIRQKLCSTAWLIMITIFAFTFADVYPPGQIPVCLARAAVGYYSFYLYSYFYLVLSIFSSIIYILVILYLKRRAGKVAPKNNSNNNENNLLEIRQTLYDRVSMALMVTVLWHSATNSLASLATIFLVHLPYRGAQIGPYLGSFYYTGAISFLICHLIFVKKFRKKFWNLLHINLRGL
uniref:G-protein coupled receptors family 1 profile domain-containing protein n=1 Tax=Romanomermis culicivorax TaxID=13658 RepID=A0A915JUD5_ROMCU